MIDVYRKQPIDEKSDIWALGVLLYKLCYYKTPFEEQGQMAILNASFKFPGYPSFSDNVKKLIASMLREQPHARPNIYQVIREVSLLRGTDVPIKDIYAGRSQSEARRNQYLPSTTAEITAPSVAGAHRATVEEKTLEIPDVTPMRRGRPTRADGGQHSHKPSPSPAKSTDPFQALDSKPGQESNALPEDIASRFPPLDQFALLHDSGGAFEFQSKPEKIGPSAQDLTRRVTNALADEAFAQGPDTLRNPPPSTTKANMDSESTDAREVQGIIRRATPETRSDQRKQSPIRPSMVSTGTMTSPTSAPSSRAPTSTLSSQPSLKFSTGQDSRPSTQSKQMDLHSTMGSNLRPTTSLPQRPSVPGHRSKSQVWTPGIPKAPSSRPSLEIQRPIQLDTHESMHRSRSTNSKSRPVSESLGSKMGFLRSRKSSGERLSSAETTHLISDSAGPEKNAAGDAPVAGETGTINTGVDFLRAMEEEDPSRRKDKRHSSGHKHVKRSSMPSISLSGTKSLITGRFGEAFRRFESNPTDGSAVLPPLSPSPSQTPHDLTPIAGSEATDGKSDDGRTIDESEDVPPEMRRELERRRLSQEERRVAAAAAAYKKRVHEAPGGSHRHSDGGRGNEKATSIQTRVRSLLDESNQSSPTKAAPTPVHLSQSPAPSFMPLRPQSIQPQPFQPPSKAPLVGRKPLTAYHSPPLLVAESSMPASPSTGDPLPPARSNAPPKPGNKPQVLRQGEARPPSPAKPSHLASKVLPSLPPQKSRSPYTPSLSAFSNPAQRLAPNETPPHKDEVTRKPTNDDWESSFNKRYPDLSGLGMTEIDIDKARAPPSRGKDTFYHNPVTGGVP